MTKIKKLFIFSFLGAVRGLRGILSGSEKSYKFLFIPGYENLRWQIGKWKAWQVFENAKIQVPAYKDFLNKQGGAKVPLTGLNPNLSLIPPMEKETYIKKYSIESRCVGGELPRVGVVIDESSGTSGTPNNWVRGPKERAAVKHALQISTHFLVGKKPIFFINAFALGPWATGMNVSMSLVDIAILKSTGPDIKKIENTLNFFGPNYDYIISGYPPFLKALVDTAKIDWAKYSIMVFFGGEGVSEGMRGYLGKAFKKTYGSYGASDLEINIASENDFTIALRQVLNKNKELSEKIIKHGVLPMIFQYNPLDYYIETNEQGELLITLCRKSNVAPKVRYNIHDLGHVIRLPELVEILKSVGLKLEDIGQAQFDFPFLFHYGRADMAVGFYGCKITPSEIENIIFLDPSLSIQINSFSLITTEDKEMNKLLILALEMRDGKEKLDDPDSVNVKIFEALKIANQDYREASAMVPKGLEPRLEIYNFGQGPFADNDIRLKKRYIQSR